MKKHYKLWIALPLIVLAVLGISFGIYSFTTKEPVTELVALQESEEFVLPSAEPILIIEETLPEPEPEPEPEPITIRLMAVGDNLMHMGLIQSGLMEDGSYNYDALYEDIALPLSVADLKIINQETILGGNELGFSGYPRFNSPTEVGDSLIHAGFNIILHASNHAADREIKGLTGCVNYWKTHPEVLMVGINDEIPEEPVIPIFENQGYTFAILNYTYSPNTEVIPSSIREHLNILCKWDKKSGAIDFTQLNPQVLEDIRLAKEMADIVIVAPHWGTEYVTTPSTYQKKWAQDMADAGADIIIGTHPHVPQPVEYLTAEDGSSCLCYYSLGNYVSTQKNPQSMLEAMAWITLTETEDGLAVVPEQTGVFPLINQYKSNPVRFDHVYFVEDYTPELAASHGILQYGQVRLDYDKVLEWTDSIFAENILHKADIFR